MNAVTATKGAARKMLTKPKTTAPKKATAKAGTGKGKTASRAQSADTTIAKQGTGTAGAPAPVIAAGAKPAGEPKAKGAATKPAGVALGGTKQVPIEVVAVSKKPYSPRARKPELYPFGELTPATKQKDGSIAGPSFFIPDSDNAEQKLMTARKRHKGVLFWSRTRKEQVDGKGPEVPGLRIWRGTKDLKPK